MAESGAKVVASRDDLNVGDIVYQTLDRNDGLTLTGDYVTRNKYFVIVGKNSKGDAIGLCLVNSNLDFYKDVPQMQKFQYILKHADYPTVLTKDSRLDCAVLFVVNRFRPLIATPQGARDCMEEIEEACGLRCTALVNNSHLGAESTAEDLLSSVGYARECAALCGLPLLCHCYMPSLVPSLPEAFARAGFGNEPLFPMEQATKQLF